MRYKSCKHIEEGINFYYNGIRFCNTLWHGHNPIEYTDDIYKNIINTRNQYISDNKNGKLLECCSNCRYLEEKDWDEEIGVGGEERKISFLTVYHWLHCNCRCFYCSNRADTRLHLTKEIKNNEKIELYPLMKKFHEEKLFSNNLNVDFIGGEPTLLKEFPDLVNLFIKHNAIMGIPTNAIIYNKIINDALNSNIKSNTTISIDSGKRETYKKIKNVDEFDNVVLNIQKYLKNSKHRKENIFIKYILLNRINDNYDEINSWFDLCEKIGIRTIFPSIEFCHSAGINSDKIINPNIVEKYLYIKEKSKEKGFILKTYNYIDELINTGGYNLNKISVKPKNSYDI